MGVIGPVVLFAPPMTSLFLSCVNLFKLRVFAACPSNKVHTVGENENTDVHHSEHAQ